MGARSFYLTQRPNGYFYAEFWCEKTTRIFLNSLINLNSFSDTPFSGKSDSQFRLLNTIDTTGENDNNCLNRKNVV
jgi:hypothetical protein